MDLSQKKDLNYIAAKICRVGLDIYLRHNTVLFFYVQKYVPAYMHRAESLGQQRGSRVAAGLWVFHMTLLDHHTCGSLSLDGYRRFLENVDPCLKG
jgi:hypothetical protein